MYTFCTQVRRSLQSYLALKIVISEIEIGIGIKIGIFGFDTYKPMNVNENISISKFP